MAAGDPAPLSAEPAGLPAEESAEPAGPADGPAWRRDVPGLVQAALERSARSIRATARLLTLVESGGGPAAAVAALLSGRPRPAAIVGITGAPGAGKSTLTGELIRLLRERGRTVAVLAVDPSSPFSGGALLGDRVRMADHAVDPGVFIRSMASRGHLGGLAAATPAAADLLAALGFDTVLIETVGVGQSEVDVMRLADTVAVVLAPGMGDGVQAAKAGILEIADVLVVNKADHEGTASTVRDLRGMVALGRGGVAEPGSWRIPVLSTVAVRGTGVVELLAELDRHCEHIADTGELVERRRRRAATAVSAVVLERISSLLGGPGGAELLSRAGAEVAAGHTDAYRAADDVIEWLRAGPG